MFCFKNKDKPLLVFEKCCCFKLRTAVIIVASLEILAGLSLLITHITFTTEHISHIVGKNDGPDSRDRSRDSLDKSSSSSSTSSSSSDDRFPRYPTIPVGAILGVCAHILIYMAVSSVLIHGVRKNRIFLMRIWLWVRAVNLLDILVESIYYLPLFILDAVGYFVLLAVSIASILVVRSYVIRLSQNEEFVQLDEVTEDV